MQLPAETGVETFSDTESTNQVSKQEAKVQTEDGVREQEQRNAKKARERVEHTRAFFKGEEFLTALEKITVSVVD